MGTKDEKDDKDEKTTNMMRVRSTLANMYTVFCVVLIAIGIISLVGVMMGLRPFVMISESMHPEVPKNALVILNTSASFDEVRPGDNVAYVLGKVEAMHKVSRIEPDKLIVRSLADDVESVITASTYLGKEVLAVPGVGGWIRGVLDYKWIVIVIAGLLVVVGCMPRGKDRKEEPQKAAAEST